MVAAWDIYAKELLPLGYGHPLWGPEPSLEFGEVHLGDVGYLREGRFCFLFNALKPADSPAHEALGVPEDFQIFKPPHLMLKQRQNEITQRQLHNKNLQSTAIAAAASVGEAVTAVGADIRYRCTEESGALQPYDPVDCLLEYILKFSNASMACATDTDITFLFNQGMSLPDDLMLALERLAPKILIDEYGVGTFGAVYSAPRETAVAPFLKGTQAEYVPSASIRCFGPNFHSTPQTLPKGDEYHRVDPSRPNLVLRAVRSIAKPLVRKCKQTHEHIQRKQLDRKMRKTNKEERNFMMAMATRKEERVMEGSATQNKGHAMASATQEDSEDYFSVLARRREARSRYRETESSDLLHSDEAVIGSYSSGATLC